MTTSKKEGYYVTTKIYNHDQFEKVLLRCLESIRRLDPNRLIIVIDGNSPYNFVRDDIPLEHIKVFKNELYPKSGEVYPYIHNYIYSEFDSYVVMHDSMILKKAIDDEKWKSYCLYLWYFDQHHKSFAEPYETIKNLIMEVSEKNQILDVFNSSSKWFGCFGNCLLVSAKYMDEIISKYNVCNIIGLVKTQNQIMACERILGILIYLHNKSHNCDSLNGSIFKHPQDFKAVSGFLYQAPLDIVLDKFNNYESYMIKIWSSAELIASQQQSENIRKEGYYIPTKVDTKDKFEKVLLRCIESIRRLDLDRHIIIVDDNSTYLFTEKDIPYSNIKIVKNELYPKSAELYPYIHNYIYPEFDSYVVMHDSMVLKKNFTKAHWNSDMMYLWCFTAHFKAFPNAMKHFKELSDLLPRSKEIYQLYDNQHKDGPPDKWVGCFGMSMLVNTKYINQMIKDFELLRLIPHVNTRYRRMATENIIAIIAYLHKLKMKPSDKSFIPSINGCIHRHPNIWNMFYSTYDLDKLLTLFKGYDAYAIKTRHDR